MRRRTERLIIVECFYHKKKGISSFTFCDRSLAQTFNLAKGLALGSKRGSGGLCGAIVHKASGTERIAMSFLKNDDTFYETTFITRPEMMDDALGSLKERVSAAVKTHKGEVKKLEDWGKKRLAYSIQKENRGHYTHLVYSGDEGVVYEIERNLRLNEHVIRFLTVKVNRLVASASAAAVGEDSDSMDDSQD